MEAEADIYESDSVDDAEQFSEEEIVELKNQVAELENQLAKFKENNKKLERATSAVACP